MDITTCSDLEIFLGGSTYAYILMRSLLTCMFLPDKGRQCLIAVRLYVPIKIKTLLKTFLRVHKQAKTGTLLKEGADLLQHLDM